MTLSFIREIILRLTQVHNEEPKYETSQKPLRRVSFSPASRGARSDIIVLMSGLKNDNYFPDTVEQSNGQARSRGGPRRNRNG